MAKFSAMPKETLGSSAYLKIRAAILEGDFEPDEILTIRAIAEQMGVSATPVRDALLQLVMERALIMPSAREIRVPLISNEEFKEIRNIRMMLEGYGAEMAVACATPAEIEALEDINDRIVGALKKKNIKRGLSLNRLFHSRLYGMAQLPVLQEILDKLWLRMSPIMRHGAVVADPQEFVEQHLEVIDALKKGDRAAARAAIASDIFVGGDRIEKALLQDKWKT